MLHRLEIENFSSIRDPQIIDLRTSGHASNDGNHLAPIHSSAKELAPKVVAIFGANASGKSNVLKALSFVSWFVRDSFSAPRGTRMPFDRFNDLAMLEAPSRLAIHLSGLEDISQAEDPNALQCTYIYEVILGGSGSASVLKEILSYSPSHASRRLKLFERDSKGTVTAARAFGLAGFRQALHKVLRPDASVIATLAQLDHPYSKSIWESANRVTKNILFERIDSPDDLVTRHYAERPELIDALNGEIERIDLGIDSMHIQSNQNGPLAAMFTHQGLAYSMPMVYESHGTRQFIKLYPSLFSALEVGGIAIIDELDSAIHPLILPEILRWFRDPVRNPRNAQLWMTCHNASLLEDLSKEEVLFCEKDGQGRTQVYGLSDIQALRRGDNYYRKYLGGAFGAVPQIG
ncbi:AAA family ATPase [Methylobacterium marchantiae]|uniref:ATP/GTP-binding protein n=1 Tax=Methylobacterium marchantiae TaxID=600331 RepID=A0ABW3X2K4_9HYPH|nr:hypothetical protein AIGOOFII_3254 [Methylobacterium marchantiae]